MRIGLLGTGPWAEVAHAPALSAHRDLDFVGVWGRRADAAKALADRHGTHAYEDVDALLDTVDAVAIALPPSVQAPLAARAARAHCHLLLDKPLAATVKEGRAVVVPPLTKNINADPPIRTTTNVDTKITSAAGSAISVRVTVVKTLSERSLQQFDEIGAEENGDENCRADDRHGQQHLKRYGGDELNRHHRPVGGGEERAALEQEIERH